MHELLTLLKITVGSFFLFSFPRLGFAHLVGVGSGLHDGRLGLDRREGWHIRRNGGDGGEFFWRRDFAVRVDAAFDGDSLEGMVGM